MDNQTKEKYLKMALVVFGVVFLLVYPLGLIWPSGWIWHGGQGNYYLQMICGIYAVLGIFLIAAARNPAANRSLIAFTIWSSVVHPVDYGSAGPFRHSGTRSPRRRCSGPAGGSWYSLVSLAERRTVPRRHGLALFAKCNTLSGALRELWHSHFAPLMSWRATSAR